MGTLGLPTPAIRRIPFRVSAVVDNHVNDSNQYVDTNSIICPVVLFAH